MSQFDSDDYDRNGDCISRSNVQLRPHQIRVVEFLRNHRGLIAAFDTGSGKTLTAIAASQCYLDENPEGRVLIVTPVSLQDNFKKEMEKYGTSSDDDRYVFLTHDGFASHFSVKGNKCTNNDMLIIDEVHNLRTHINKIEYERDRKMRLGKQVKPSKAEVAWTCAAKVAKVLLLTATPVINQPCDVENLVSMVKGVKPGYCPKLKYRKSGTLAVSKKPYSKFHYEIYDLQTGIVDKKAFDEHFECTFAFFHISKDNVDYPSLEEHNIYIPMTKSFYRNYRVIENRVSAMHLDREETFYFNVRAGTNIIRPKLKIDWIINKVREGKKTLIYSNYIRDGLDTVIAALNRYDIPYSMIRGDVPKKKRQILVNKFNDPDSDVTVFLITKAGGEGIDLKGVRNVIMMDAMWNRSSEEQILTFIFRKMKGQWKFTT